jgi:hypothetical protein
VGRVWRPARALPHDRRPDTRGEIAHFAVVAIGSVALSLILVGAAILAIGLIGVYGPVWQASGP